MLKRACEEKLFPSVINVISQQSNKTEKKSLRDNFISENLKQYRRFIGAPKVKPEEMIDPNVAKIEKMKRFLKGEE